MIHKPKHPGKVVKRLCMGSLDISVTDAAKFKLAGIDSIAIENDLRYSIEIILDRKTGDWLSSLITLKPEEMGKHTIPDHDFFKCKNWNLLFSTYGDIFWFSNFKGEEKVKDELWRFSIAACLNPTTFKIFEKFLDFIAPYIIAADGEIVGEGFDLTKHDLNYIKYFDKKLIIEDHTPKNSMKSKKLTIHQEWLAREVLFLLQSNPVLWGKLIGEVDNWNKIQRKVANEIRKTLPKANDT